MPNDKPKMEETNRILVKLRPTGASALRAAESRAQLRPLHEGQEQQAQAAGFGLDSATPRWFLAEMPDGAATPWDLAHARVADQLGVSESDVLFAEPDLVHAVFDDDGKPVSFFRDTNEAELSRGLAAGDMCEAKPQDGGHGKKLGPDKFAWHLDDEYTQLGSAREAVKFAEPRTRIAHLDTGYYRAHATAPEFVARPLERSFVEGEENRQSAEDPDNNVFLIDNSGHGTGTIGILAGKALSPGGTRLGGAPDAEVLPLRVTDRVVLLRTSSLAQAIRYATDQRCDVITMSLGGVPTRAWAEEVDRAYEAGVVVCAAAGNHIGFSPPRTLVYPARYPRVLAVCGVMADGTPYTGLKGFSTLEGSFGPDAAMTKAVASYTPNIPWPLYMCPDVIRLNGEGTSAATPQVAAAVALWLERYKNELPPRDWRRGEAARNAIFSSTKMRGDKTHFGNGVLQARRALDVKPALGLPKSANSENSIPILRLVTGLGIAQIPPREEMFNQEFAQRWLLNDELQELLP
ncbi:MAG TPA: S8/S53 family peptidase, partial [Pyrinomonadaceae bacterium]